jgi:UDP-N-acetylmuramate--alanine ligase
MERYHFIGIGGIGMIGLARILLQRKIAVSGSDLALNKVIESLVSMGGKVHIGHSETHIEPGMTVVYSTDIKKNNPEYLAAISMKCPLLHRSELLQRLMQNHDTLSVAGTHGKTTTSALLAWVLESSHYSPSYMIGGIVPQFSSNANDGNGRYFVAESCESDGTFLNYTPYGAIITNIDLDHMDHYRTEAALMDSFKRFMLKVKSTDHLFWCGDDKRLQNIASQGISYGFEKQCQFRLSNFEQHAWRIHFDVEFQDKKYSQIEVALSGRHNALNASAVFGLALQLGINEEAIRLALRTFKGVLRRCEHKGEMNGIVFLDDYAHHPTELRATLSAIRKAIGKKRLIVLYQPHRYSRAKECMGLYNGVFQDVDMLYVTEIYASNEPPIPGVTHEKIIHEIQQDLFERCRHVTRAELAAFVTSVISSNDVVVTLGAGDITKASGEILSLMKLPAASCGELNPSD